MMLHHRKEVRRKKYRTDLVQMCKKLSTCKQFPICVIMARRVGAENGSISDLKQWLTAAEKAVLWGQRYSTDNRRWAKYVITIKWDEMATGYNEASIAYTDRNDTRNVRNFQVQYWILIQTNAKGNLTSKRIMQILSTSKWSIATNVRGIYRRAGACAEKNTRGNSRGARSSLQCGERNLVMCISSI